jgi:hypothetical protein
MRVKVFRPKLVRVILYDCLFILEQMRIYSAILSLPNSISLFVCYKNNECEHVMCVGLAISRRLVEFSVFFPERVYK